MRVRLIWCRRAKELFKMSLILKRQEIIDFLEEKGYNDSTTKIVWANIGNARGMQVVLAFNETGIYTILITPLGKIDGEIIVLNKDEIQSVSFKKGLMAYQLKIETADSEVPDFRINKTMIGYKGQKEDLADLLERYQ